MSNVLDRIVEHKREEISASKKLRPEAALRRGLPEAPAVRDFEAALRAAHPMGLIAEVKKASPSAGVIRADFDPVEIARIYESHGAACISVLTDERFFQGRLEYLSAIRRAVEAPVLRKDFLLDTYQLVEARVAGADCVLLIAECLSDGELAELYAGARELGMQTLIEIYEPANLQRVLNLSPQPTFMGVNNRNLQNFTTDLEHCVRLRREIPEGVLLVGESGVRSRADVLRLRSAGVNAMLVGESLMRHEDIGRQVNALLHADP